MKPIGHVISTAVIAGGCYIATGSPAISLSTMGIGVLIDTDHFFDYGYYLIIKKRMRELPKPSKFIDCNYMEVNQKTFLPLHSYELLILIWGLCLAFSTVSLALWLSVALVLHLVIDQFTYRPHPGQYSLIFKILKKFDRYALGHKEKRSTGITDTYNTDYPHRPYELRPPTDAIKDRMIVDIVRKSANGGGQLLDVGCGMGQLSGRISSYYSITGIDLSDEAVKIAQKNVKGVFLHGDAQSLSFPEASFDFVIAKDILEHVANDEKVISEISRVSKAKAKLITYLPNDLDHFNLSTEYVVRKLTGYTLDRDVGHLRRYTVTGAKQMLQAQGYKTIKTWYVVHFSLGIMGLLTVKGFRLLRKREKTGLITNKKNQTFINIIFKLFELIGELETLALKRLPGAGFFIIAEKLQSEEKPAR